MYLRQKNIYKDNRDPMIVDYNKIFQQHTMSCASTATGRAVVEIQKNVVRQYSALSYEANKRNRTPKKPATIISHEAALAIEQKPNTKCVSWKSLDMCEKYKLLKAFMEDNNTDKKEAVELVKALKRGTLEVEYDKSSKSVSKASLPASKEQISGVD